MIPRWFILAIVVCILYAPCELTRYIIIYPVPDNRLIAELFIIWFGFITAVLGLLLVKVKVK